MAYFEGTLSGTQTGLTVMADIKAELDGNLPTGWSFVEEHTESSVTWHVYKCAAAQSGLPNDFHVVLTDTQAGSAEIGVYVCEGYDTTTHRMKRPAFNYASGGSTSAQTLPAGAGDSIGDDDTLYRPSAPIGKATRTAGTGLPTYTSGAVRRNISPLTAWSVFVYADAMVISFKAAANAGVYCGAFSSLVKESATNDPMPTGIFGFGMTAYVAGTANTFSTGGGTRSAMNAGISLTYQQLDISPWHPTAVPFNSPTDSNTWDKYSPTEGVYAQPYIVFRNGGGTNYSTGGRIRGRLKYVVAAAQGGAAWGDSIEIGVDTYQFIGSSTWALRDDL
jgi:hypothetical protein